MSYLYRCACVIVAFAVIMIGIPHSSIEVQAQYGNTSSCIGEDVRDSGRGWTAIIRSWFNGGQKQGADRVDTSKCGIERVGASKQGADRIGSTKQGAEREGSTKVGDERDGQQLNETDKSGAEREGSTKEGAVREGDSTVLLGSGGDLFGSVSPVSEYAENSSFSSEAQIEEEDDTLARDTGQSIQNDLESTAKNITSTIASYFGNIEDLTEISLPTTLQRTAGVISLSFRLFTPVLIVTSLTYLYLKRHKDFEPHLDIEDSQEDISD